MTNAERPKWAADQQSSADVATADSPPPDPTGPAPSKTNSVSISHKSTDDGPRGGGTVALSETTTKDRSIAPVLLAAFLGAMAAGLLVFFLMRAGDTSSVTAAPSAEPDAADLAGASTSSTLSIVVERQSEEAATGIGEVASPSESNQAQPDDAPITRTDASVEASIAATCRLDLLAGTVDEVSLVCDSGTIEISGSTESWHNDVTYLVLDEGVTGQLEFEAQSDSSPSPLMLAAGANTPDRQASLYGTRQLTVNFTGADQHVHVYSEPNRQGRELTLHYRP